MTFLNSSSKPCQVNFIECSELCLLVYAVLSNHHHDVDWIFHNWQM